MAKQRFELASPSSGVMHAANCDVQPGVEEMR